MIATIQMETKQAKIRCPQKKKNQMKPQNQAINEDRPT
jgi:hypothetical protein